MTTVTLLNVEADRAIEIARELRQYLRQHDDFSYKFIQGKYDWVTHEMHERKVEFTFRNPADATAFTLKYL